jgi:hypothetical protein
MDGLWVALGELRSAALDGRLQDAPTVLAVLLVAAQGYAGARAAGE